MELETELLLNPQHCIVSGPGCVTHQEVGVVLRDFDEARTARKRARGVLLSFPQNVLQVEEIAVQAQEPAVSECSGQRPRI